MEKEKKTQTAIDIRMYINYGQQNAVSREYLRTITGLTDRKIRALISAENLNDERPPIVNLGHGYFIATPDDLEAVSAYCKIEISRARQIEHKVRHCLGWLDRSDSSQYRMEI